MNKKIIQMPVNLNLLAELETHYRKGYKQTPEAQQLAEAQLDLTKRVIAPEQW